MARFGDSPAYVSEACGILLTVTMGVVCGPGQRLTSAGGPER